MNAETMQEGERDSRKCVKVEANVRGRPVDMQTFLHVDAEGWARILEKAHPQSEESADVDGLMDQDNPRPFAWVQLFVQSIVFPTTCLTNGQRKWVTLDTSPPPAKQ
jgi:hypothetical protein